MDNVSQQSQIAQSPLQPQFPNSSSPTSEKPIWQTDAFIILALVIFWPIGLILMWKFAPWRRLVKSLITIFFSLTILLPIVIFTIFSFMLLGSAGKRSEFGKPPPTPGAQQPTESKVYYFEDLRNGFVRVTSPKYKFSFEFSSDLKYFPPVGEEQPGVLESIGFQTEKRMRNDISSIFVISFAPSTTGNPCSSYKTLPNWSQTTVGGLEAVKSGKPDNQTIILCSGTYNYSFSYHGAYTPKKEGALSPEEIAKEKEAYDYMLQTFKVMP